MTCTSDGYISNKKKPPCFRTIVLKRGRLLVRGTTSVYTLRVHDNTPAGVTSGDYAASYSAKMRFSTEATERYPSKSDLCASHQPATLCKPCTLPLNAMRLFPVTARNGIYLDDIIAN